MRRPTSFFHTLPRIAAALLVLIPAAGRADMLAENPAAYATSPRQQNGAAYMTIKNTEAAADMLTSVSTPVAERAELHTTEMARNAETGTDIMSMRPVESVAVPEDGAIKFEPMGKHIMLMGLKKQLVAGDTFPLTLHFEKAGAVEVQVLVVNPGDDGVMPHEGHETQEMHDH